MHILIFFLFFLSSNSTPFQALRVCSVNMEAFWPGPETDSHFPKTICRNSTICYLCFFFVCVQQDSSLTQTDVNVHLCIYVLWRAHTQHVTKVDKEEITWTNWKKKKIKPQRVLTVQSLLGTQPFTTVWCDQTSSWPPRGKAVVDKK